MNGEKIIDTPTMRGLREAAKQVGVSYSCLRRWILTGQFSGFVKSGNRYLINIQHLSNFLNGCSHDNPVIIENSKLDKEKNNNGTSRYDAIWASIGKQY